jgi:hypothetical protein
VSGALLALLGAGTVAAAATGVSASAVLATARTQGASAGGAFGGSTTSGAPGAGHAIVIAGSAGRAVASGAPWPELAVAGAVAIVLAGLATAWRGPRWPVMSARYERGAPSRAEDRAEDQAEDRAEDQAGGRGRNQAKDAATMWESLSRDMDPTVDGR